MDILDDGDCYFVLLLNLGVLEICRLVGLDLGQCFVAEEYIFGPKSTELAGRFVLGFVILVNALLLDQPAILVLLAVDEAALVDVLLGLVETLLVVVLPLLELPCVSDLLLLEVDLSLAVGHALMEASLELILFGVDNPLDHLAVLPHSLKEGIFGMIFKATSPIGLPVLELPLKPSILVQEDPSGLRVNAIICVLFQLSLEVDGLGEYCSQFLGQVVNVVPVFMQLPPRSPRLLVVLLEEVVAHLMDGVPQLGTQSQEDDVEGHLHLKLIDPLPFL